MNTPAPLGITGYVNRWSACASERLGFHVSSVASSYRAELRRLIHGDDNPAGPGVKEEVIDIPLNHEVLTGKYQPIHNGSCMIVPKLPDAGVFMIAGVFQSTLRLPTRQTITALALDIGTISLSIEDGKLALRHDLGDGAAVLDGGIDCHIWYDFVLSIDLGRSTITARSRSNGFTPLEKGGIELGLILPPEVGKARTLLFAASAAEWQGKQCRIDDTFNGRLADLRLFSGEQDANAAFTDWRQLRPIGAPPAAAWDFVAECETTKVPDLAGGFDAITVNRPTRLITGPNYRGESLEPLEAPQYFNAAHFHDDDLADAGWEESFAFTVPSDLRSGIYAFRISCEGHEDYIPFMITPRPGEAVAPLAVLVPTMSYQVYANMRMDPTILPEEIMPLADRSGPTPEEIYLDQNRLASCYDLHSDQSGICMASSLRPMLIFVRPRSRNRLNSSPHQLCADLHLIDWLEARKIPYDAITEHDLHFRGAALLKPYRAVVSGSHSEYWSEAMLDALGTYQEEGGRFAYLSGNGLYWVTELNEDGTLAEIRRDQGLRAWTAAPGEAHISLTGRRGGTWRYRGRASQKYVGVGHAAMGFDRGRPYARTAASHDPRAAFLFEGIEEELIGDFPALVCAYGAAGLEIDRAEQPLGTPAHALVLATASGFSDCYQIGPEDVPATSQFYGGSTCPDVRADMVFYETPNGGAVFSTGSISWCSALSYNGYDNTVSRLTENALRAFSSEMPFLQKRSERPG